MKKNDFEYSYIAPTREERQEIESIRNSYARSSKTGTKIDYLRKLDSKVKNTPTCVALIVGIVGILIFGLGLSMALEWKMIVWGAVVSLIGLLITVLAYPIWLRVGNAMKKKYSDKIISLSDELLNGEKTND